MSASNWKAEQQSQLDRLSLDRAAEIKHLRRRDQFLLGRILLKKALQHVVGETAAGWRLEPSNGGKPVLIGPQGPAGMAVSLSHSAQRVVCALAECNTIGIDIEHCKPRDFHVLSEQLMTPAERKHLAGLESAARGEFFYQCWTVKEACAKAIGAEQAPAFNRIEVCVPEMWAQKEEMTYAGLLWGGEEYVTSLIGEGGISQVEVFRLDVGGGVQASDLKGGAPVWARLLADV